MPTCKISYSFATKCQSIFPLYRIQYRTNIDNPSQIYLKLKHHKNLFVCTFISADEIFCSLNYWRHYRQIDFYENSFQDFGRIIYIVMGTIIFHHGSCLECVFSLNSKINDNYVFWYGFHDKHNTIFDIHLQNWTRSRIYIVPIRTCVVSWCQVYFKSVYVRLVWMGK